VVLHLLLVCAAAAAAAAAAVHNGKLISSPCEAHMQQGSAPNDSAPPLWCATLATARHRPCAVTERSILHDIRVLQAAV
jgi:hypothetical protein